MFLWKFKNVFYVFYLQVNVFNIYGYNDGVVLRLQYCPFPLGSRCFNSRQRVRSMKSCYDGYYLNRYCYRKEQIWQTAERQNGSGTGHWRTGHRRTYFASYTSWTSLACKQQKPIYSHLYSHPISVHQMSLALFDSNVKLLSLQLLI